MIITKNKIAVWIQALRVFSFTATAVPILLCVAIASHEHKAYSWLSVVLILIGIIALHAGTNLVNDYFDYKRGLDTAQTLGSSRVLVDNLLSMQELKYGIIGLYLIATLCGIYFLGSYGLPLAIILLVGLAGSFLYTGGGRFSFKYLALGEISTFILIGPFLFVGTYLALTGAYSWTVLAVSIPLGLLSAAIVSSNNIRDIAEDQASGIKTIGTLFGRQTATAIYTGELVAAYLCILVFMSLKLFNFSSLIVFSSIPIAKKMVKIFRQNKVLSPMVPAQTAQLQMLYGLILTLSFVLPF